MATFPSLPPSGRVFTNGDYPQTQFVSMSRAATRVRHSNTTTTHRLALTFIGLEESEAASVVDHYHQQLGTFEPFALPASAWNGVTSSDYVDGAIQWRYAEQPEIIDRPCRPDGTHLYEVRVALESVRASGIQVYPGGSLPVGAIVLAAGGLALDGAALSAGLPSLSAGALTAATAFYVVPSPSWGTLEVGGGGEGADSLARLVEDDLLELW